MQLAGRISGLVFEALREMGKAQIIPQHIRTLQQTLTPEQKNKTLHDLRQAPAWMHPYIREIARNLNKDG